MRDEMREIPSCGYCGIGIYHPKRSVNVGTLWRTAYILGAAFIFVIGRRYSRQCSDTLASTKHVPLYEYTDYDTFLCHLPRNSRLVGVELTPSATLVDDYHHPERAVYLLGAEDGGIPPSVLARCSDVIKLRGQHSMNVATAGSIVLYQRGVATRDGKHGRYQWRPVN